MLDNDETIEIIGPVESFKKIGDALKTANVSPDESGLRLIAKQEVDLPVDAILQVLKLIDTMEELDDVQNVFHNVRLTDEALAALEAAG